VHQVSLRLGSHVGREDRVRLLGAVKFCLFFHVNTAAVKYCAVKKYKSVHVQTCKQ